MKKFTLILILVILISLTLVGPAFAGGGDNPGKACENITGSGWFWGWRQAGAKAQGHFYGPVVAYFKVCR